MSNQCWIMDDMWTHVLRGKQNLKEKIQGTANLIPTWLHICLIFTSIYILCVYILQLYELNCFFLPKENHVLIVSQKLHTFLINREFIIWQINQSIQHSTTCMKRDQLLLVTLLGTWTNHRNTMNHSIYQQWYGEIQCMYTTLNMFVCARYMISLWQFTTRTFYLVSTAHIAAFLGTFFAGMGSSDSERGGSFLSFSKYSVAFINKRKAT